jgi:predicted outer membrane protein
MKKVQKNIEAAKLRLSGSTNEFVKRAYFLVYIILLA